MAASLAGWLSLNIATTLSNQFVLLLIGCTASDWLCCFLLEAICMKPIHQLANLLHLGEQQEVLHLQVQGFHWGCVQILQILTKVSD